MEANDSSEQTGVLVIGAGPGGYVAAIRAAQLGLDATLVEREAHGGVCLNHGCIPSKALISAADVAHRARTAGEMGIDADVSVDFGRMVGWKDGVVERLTGGVRQLCRANGVDLVEGRAEFVSDSAVRVVGDDGGGSRRIEFERAIVATGSRPTRLPGFDFDDGPVLSSREALALDALPERLVVVGAGYIGMELSTVFAKLGTDVTVVEMLDDVLPGYEADVGELVRRRAEELGVAFRFGEAVQGWSRGEAGVRVVTEDRDGDRSEYDAERLLVAVGREPVTDTLALSNAGLEPNEDGFLDTDERGRTDVDTVYAVGDVAGEPMLAHVAMREGIVAAHDAAGEPTELDYRTVPTAVFTDPEIATVGMTEAEAEAAGFTPMVGRMPFGASGRAMTTGETDGFVRIVAIRESGALLGAQIVGPDASELIAELGLAIGRGATAEELAETVHVHPTLAEAVMEAAEQALGRAVHTTN